MTGRSPGAITGRSAAAAVLTVALLAATATPAAANPSYKTRDALEQGRTAYDRGDYHHAIDTIHPLLYPSIELGTEDDVVLAHRLLALSYFFVQKPKEAEAEVTSLLALRPNYALDPIVDPPLAVRFFEDVRRRQSDRLHAIERREQEEAEQAKKERDREEAEARAHAQRIYVDRLVERHSRLIALIPFGVGQIQNGQLGKGILFGSAELVLAAVSIGTWASLTYDSRYPLDPSNGHRLFPAGDEQRVATLLGFQLGAAAAFYAVVAWGIIDAQVLFKRDVVREENERKGTPKKKAPSLSFTPLTSPTLVGVGLQGTF
jgi:hypothetical protein